MADDIFCILICTRKRPELLKRSIKSVAEELARDGYRSEILIVENDEACYSAGVVNQLRSEYPDVRIAYFLEQNLGLASARNRAVTLGLSSGADWIAFIDDDEQVLPGWLAAMRRAAATIDAEVLTGPVRYIFEKQHFWMPLSTEKSRERGSTLSTAATNNTAIRAAWLRSRFPLLNFDEDFNHTGGEDSDFFYRLADMGGRIRWVDDAWVSEHVPAVRAACRYQLARSARVSENVFRIHRRRRGLAAALRRYLPKALGRLIGGAFYVFGGLTLVLFVKPIGGRMIFNGCKALASTFGIVLAILGLRLEPYRT